jgi:hypothetical protein
MPIEAHRPRTSWHTYGVAVEFAAPRDTRSLVPACASSVTLIKTQATNAFVSSVCAVQNVPFVDAARISASVVRTWSTKNSSSCLRSTTRGRQYAYKIALLDDKKYHRQDPRHAYYAIKRIAGTHTTDSQPFKATTMELSKDRAYQDIVFYVNLLNEWRMQFSVVH